MATYQETIELVDNVSGPANAAATAVDGIDKAAGRAKKSLADLAGQQLAASPFDSAAASAEKFAQSLINAVGLAKELAGVKAPTIGAPVAAPSVNTPIASPLAAPSSPTAPASPAAPTAQQPAFGPIKVDMDAAVAQFKTLTSSLKAAEGAMTRAQALGDQDGFAKAAAKADMFRSALDKLPAGTADAANSGKGLSKTMWDARNAMDLGRQSIGAAIAGIKTAFASLAQGDVKGAIAGVTDAIAGMAKMLDLVVPGLGEVVSAVVSIVGGLVGATAGMIVSGAKFAVAANQGKQAMLSMFDAMGGGIVTGEQLDAMLSDLADRISISKDELVPLTQAFLQMGVTSVDALEKLTTAAISAEAITKGGAAAFTELQKKIQLAIETGQGFKLGEKQLLKLRDAGIGVSEIAEKMGMTTQQLTAALAAGSVDAKKFGDAMTEAIIDKGAKPLERMASSFDAIKKKFDQDIGDLFEDIDVGPFMKEVKELFAIFGQGKPSGEALKAGIGGFFKEVFELATKVVPLVRHFLLDIVIWGLQAYIALKPITKAIRDFFNSATGSAVLSMALDAIIVAIKAAAIGIAVVVGLFITITSLIIAFDVAIVAAVAAIFEFGASLISSIVGGLSGAIDAISAWIASAVQMGSDFVAGLVQGITSGFTLVTDAVGGLADGAVNTFKSALGIASPSRVMMGLGGFTTEGFAQGVESGLPDVHGAATSIADATVSGVTAGGASSPSAAGAAALAAASTPAAGSSGGGTTITFAEGAIVIQGAGKSVTEITEEAMATAWEHAAELMAAAA